MDFWSRARSFAEDAAKRSQELTKEAAKRSQELAAGGPSRLADVVSEAAKRSMEIAAEASKRADQIKLEAIKRADRLRSLAEGSGVLAVAEDEKDEAADLEKFGVTDELREFVKEITVSTFQDFPLRDDSEMSDVPTVSNVRQDLTEFQEKHAKLVLSSVKEISKLRYELCPRIMKERKFWRIYFILINTHVAPYERQYMEDIRQKASGEVKKASEEVKEPSNGGIASKAEIKELNDPSKLSKTSTSTEQDLDVFLLGDLGDDDEGLDDGDADFDDDFDKMGFGWRGRDRVEDTRSGCNTACILVVCIRDIFAWELKSETFVHNHRYVLRPFPFLSTCFGLSTIFQFLAEDKMREGGQLYKVWTVK